ncbi:MAG: protein kinase [Propionibacteriaceae bacterium]|jgi:serine/threonine protein kinase|nr:protein kinase [Propionibacteriaceae bacterium]
MTVSRRPYEPPQIDGFEVVRLLGQGGFADVFLCQQHRPSRPVAIKVLLADKVGGQQAQQIEAEADAMAGLSQHRNIVTVFAAGTTSDGRSYLVMDYYPKSLGRGWRRARLSIAEALATGIQLAGAVESAHRVRSSQFPHGILHRDIKPDNILIGRSGQPVLGDFGIAMAVDQAGQGAEGLSVPWSPPEMLGTAPHSLPASDVWSLAATLYGLLTGLAPFETGDGTLPNTAHHQADRIRRDPYRPLGRPDAPASFDQVLRTAMAKDPAVRYPTMQAFGRALGQVEQELGLQPTPLEVIESLVSDDMTLTSLDDDDGTRLSPFIRIDPTGTTHESPARSVPDYSAPVTGPGPLANWPSASTASMTPTGATPSGVSPTGQSAPVIDQTGSSTGAVVSDDLTALRATPAVSPAVPAAAPITAVPQAGPEIALTQHRVDRPPAGLESPGQQFRPHPVTATQQRLTPPQKASDRSDEAAAEPRSAPWRIVVPLVVAVIVAGLVVWVLVRPTPEPPIPVTPSVTNQTQDVLPGQAVPAPTNLRCVVEADQFVIDWTNPDPRDGDTYLYTAPFGQPLVEAEHVPTGQGERLLLPRVDDPQPYCFEIQTVRASRTSDGTRQCCVIG